MLGCLENASEAQGMLGKMIMDAMENYIEETASNEKADQKIVDKVNKVLDVAKELSDELKRKVTVEELMQETGMSRSKIMEAIRFSGNNIEYIEVEE